MATYEQMLAEYKRLAKRADQRLVRIEQYSKQPNYQGMTKFAYSKAMRNIHAYSGQGANRFNTAPPKNPKQLQAKIDDIKAFLEAPTSTKLGTTRVYKDRVKTFNENHGTNFTWQEYGAFFESAEWEKIKSEFKYSETLVQAIASIRRKGEEIKPDMIKKANMQNMLLDEDEVVDELAKRLLKRGFTYAKMFK